MRTLLTAIAVIAASSAAYAETVTGFLDLTKGNADFEVVNVDEGEAPPTLKISNNEVVSDYSGLKLYGKLVGKTVDGLFVPSEFTIEEYRPLSAR